jgi:hypothetical protein
MNVESLELKNALELQNDIVFWCESRDLNLLLIEIVSVHKIVLVGCQEWDLDNLIG